jgi:tetratricopeptide (TPR) repeat protein
MRRALVLALALVATAARAGDPPSSLTQAQLDVLKRLIDATPDDSPEKPDLLFRRAEMYLQQARFYAAHPERPDAAKKRVEWQRAGIAALIAVADEPRFAGYSRADEVLFYLAWELTQSQRESSGRAYYQRLLTLHPRSKFTPDAMTALGDASFDKGDLVAAAALYQKVVALGPSRTRDYAQYKLAWCALDRADYDEALAQFAHAARADNDKIRVEARRDYVRTFARSGGDPFKARERFEAVDGAHVEEMLDQLAADYRSDGKLAECRRLVRGTPCE